MDEKEAEARPLMGTIFLVITCHRVVWSVNEKLFFKGRSRDVLDRFPSQTVNCYRVKTFFILIQFSTIVIT